MELSCLSWKRPQGQGELKTEWLDRVGNIETARFDVSQPYVAISFLLIKDTKTEERKRGERVYENKVGQLHVYLWDGEKWSDEEVK